MSEPFARLLEEKLQLSTYVPQFGDTAVITGRQWQIITSDVEVYEPELMQLREYLTELEQELSGYRQKVEALVGWQECQVAGFNAPGGENPDLYPQNAERTIAGIRIFRNCI